MYILLCVALIVTGCISGRIDESPDAGQHGATCESNDGAYVIDDLDGTCRWEWCMNDGLRVIRDKPAGWPCVYRVAPTAPVFSLGQCNEDGECE
jgi:hypothetical protein